MTNTERVELGLSSAADAGGCGCGGCGCGAGENLAVSAAAATRATEQTFAVTGMTCNNCVNHVSQAVTALPGVAAVRIDLDPAGVSKLHVTGGAAEIDVRAAVESAGYHLLS